VLAYHLRREERGAGNYITQFLGAVGENFENHWSEYWGHEFEYRSGQVCMASPCVVLCDSRLYAGLMPHPGNHNLKIHFRVEHGGV
jgi:hypothetical protein